METSGNGGSGSEVAGSNRGEGGGLSGNGGNDVRSWSVGKGDLPTGEESWVRAAGVLSAWQFSVSSVVGSRVGELGPLSGKGGNISDCSSESCAWFQHKVGDEVETGRGSR